jgi:predicted small secreted protein
MKRQTLLLCASLLVVFVLGGCATLRGMGEDIQNLGRGLKKTVSE